MIGEEKSEREKKKEKKVKLCRENWFLDLCFLMDTKVGIRLHNEVKLKWVK